MKKVAIIGAGLQGSRRLSPILETTGYKVNWVIDLDQNKAKKLSDICGARSGIDWKSAVNDEQVDAVLVLTYPDSHALISIAAMKNGKDVLCEKPLARTEGEAKEMVKTADKTKRILKCGFNHRHHPAVLEAHKIVDQGSLGKIIFGRGIYGIFGREGLEKEWRSDPKIVSGGQLMEQGVHLIDLFRWFLGEVVSVSGMVDASYWPIKPLEDNGFVLLKTKNGNIASVHSSLTQWINLFEFEVCGEKGYLEVQGLGGGYGNEKLIYGIRDPVGPFSYKTVEYRGGDVSWKNEWIEFIKSVENRMQPIGNGEDGLKAIEIVNAAYKSSKMGKRIDFNL